MQQAVWLTSTSTSTNTSTSTSSLATSAARQVCLLLGSSGQASRLCAAFWALGRQGSWALRCFLLTPRTPPLGCGFGELLNDSWFLGLVCHAGPFPCFGLFFNHCFKRCNAMVQKLSAMTSAVILCGIGLLFVIASNLRHEMLPQCSKNLILWLLRRTTDWLTLMWWLHWNWFMILHPDVRNGTRMIHPDSRVLIVQSVTK